MGRVLLAALSAEELDARLAATDLRALTPHGLADEAALRAELTRVAERGWCVVDQELEPGLRSVAAPVHDRDGAVRAALNVSTHAARYSPDQLTSEVIPEVLATARALSADLALVNR
jgi:IclR family pca regulon transcriptional regulator